MTKKTFEIRGIIAAISHSLDVRLEIKACDPWAVHSATKFRRGSGLQAVEGVPDVQREICKLVKRNGKVEREEAMERFDLPEKQMQAQLAVLRHGELIKRHKEQDKLYLVPYS